jgi:hypothetical protein
MLLVVATTAATAGTVISGVRQPRSVNQGIATKSNPRAATHRAWAHARWAAQQLPRI